LSLSLQVRQPTSAVAGLSGGCTEVDFHYMVPVVDGGDKVQIVKAMGVDSIAVLDAMDVPADIEKRFPQTRGYRDRLAKPARDVELLIGMDNQGWMPKQVGSSQVKGDNLRLMQSMLGPACILMGSAKVTDPGDGTQGSAGGHAAGASAPDEILPRGRTRGMDRPGKKRQELLLTNCLQVMLTMMLVLLAGMLKCTAFRAYDDNNQSAQIEQYSLLDPEPCGNMDKVHDIERELYKEIVQIKKEQLVQVTRCTASQTIKSTY
jgi:hypothetical protein